MMDKRETIVEITNLLMDRCVDTQQGFIVKWNTIIVVYLLVQQIKSIVVKD